MPDRLKCYILNRFANKSQNYTSWMKSCPLECVVVDEVAAQWSVPDDAALIVTHMHYRWEEVSALRRIYDSGKVPILILADGIVEFRNTWENPNVADGSVYNPIIGHKLACIGRGQARIVESWGNAGKCEIVGIPRLSGVETVEHLPVQPDGPFRILIATASTPSFTTDQKNAVVNALKSLKLRFENNRFVGVRPIEVSWRLTDGLFDEVGVSSTRPDSTLEHAIELSDAVITTPSTLYLESVLRRRPTAILDFNNSPSFVPSAWTISAPAHINPVLEQLQNPCAAKMQYQRHILNDQLEPGDVNARLFQLMAEMAQAGVIARENSEPIKLAPRILHDPQRGFQRVDNEFDLGSLFPANQTFRRTDVQHLQVELNHATIRLGELPEQLNEKEAYIQELTGLLAASNQRESQLARQLQGTLDNLQRKSEHIEMLNELVNDGNQRAKRNNLKAIELSQVVNSKNEEIQSLRVELRELKNHPLWLAEKPLIRLFDPDAPHQDSDANETTVSKAMAAPNQNVEELQDVEEPQILKFPPAKKAG